MRLGLGPQRIRAVARWAKLKFASAVTALNLTVFSHVIKISYILGYFVKQLIFTEQPKVDDVNTYFAEDYVEEGYVIDGFYVVFGKYTVDSVAQTDVVVVRFTKVISDIVLASDSFSISGSGTRATVDVPKVGDYGIVRMQDYCPYDYFVEDYVGTSRTFT